MRLIAAILAMLTMVGAAHAQTVRLAVTTSFHNSGLSDILLPAIEDDLGLEVQLLVVGTGQALALGEAGDVDAVLVHSRAAEEAFVAEGYGTHRREIMYNDFVIVGPASDPAGVGGAGDLSAALESLAEGTAPFVSRGDDSGTHRRERALWGMIDANADAFDSGWYREAGSGMGATLNTAVGLGAYTLSDRASWLNFDNKSDYEILFEGDAALFNQYAFLPVDPARHPHVKAEAVARLEEWLAGPDGQAMIDGYRLSGEKLFTANATDP